MSTPADEVKHTPGPWRVIEYDGRGPMEVQSSEYPGASLALVYAAFPERELKANAELIASAPDLLEKMKELEAQLKDLKFITDMIREENQRKGQRLFESIALLKEASVANFNSNLGARINSFLLESSNH